MQKKFDSNENRVSVRQIMKSNLFQSAACPSSSRCNTRCPLKDRRHGPLSGASGAPTAAPPPPSPSGKS